MKILRPGKRFGTQYWAMAIMCCAPQLEQLAFGEATGRQDSTGEKSMSLIRSDIKVLQVELHDLRTQVVAYETVRIEEVLEQVDAAIQDGILNQGQAQVILERLLAKQRAEKKKVISVIDAYTERTDNWTQFMKDFLDSGVTVGGRRAGAEGSQRAEGPRAEGPGLKIQHLEVTETMSTNDVNIGSSPP